MNYQQFCEGDCSRCPYRDKCPDSKTEATEPEVMTIEEMARLFLFGERKGG